MVTAKVSVFDAYGILGATLDRRGDSFRLKDLVTPERLSGDIDPFEAVEQALVEALLEKGHARVATHGGVDYVEVIGTGGRLLGDDLSDVRLEIVGQHRDRGSFASHDTTYSLIVKIPASALE